MLVIKKIKSFRAVVEFDVPQEGKTEHQRLQFTAEFDYLNLDEWKALNEQAQKDEVPDQVVMDRVMKDWYGVAGADGASIPFTPANLDELTYTFNNARRAIVEAWLKNNFGAKTGN